VTVGCRTSAGTSGRHSSSRQPRNYGTPARPREARAPGQSTSARTDGPLPDIEPSADELDPSRGTIAIERRSGKLQLIEGWRDLAAERGLSIRQLVLEVSGGHATFTGTPGQIADTWAHYVRTRAVDGFNVTPHPLPSSLADIVDKVVPALQDRGVYRRVRGHHTPRASGSPATAARRRLPQG
jgi:alkanesulfonate monooxygenase SsuD/methylene tetrahydromethanopterin reductase-like flavin-dependent oxidoreductase (luciferase family)